MQLDISDTAATRPVFRLPMLSLRWSGVFAGLVVGIATNLLLLLVGAAVGLAAVDVGEDLTRPAVPIAVSAWNTVSMIIAAFVGGYVAARSAGLHRNSDGVLHGAVSWGATMIVSAIIATSAAGATLGGLFAAAQGRADVSRSVAGNIQEGDRQSAISNLQSSLGLSADQAAKAVDQALILSGRAERASPAGRESAERTIDTAAVASGWLSAAVLLSLAAGIGGGVLGARGTRRIVRNRTPSATEISAREMARGVD